MWKQLMEFSGKLFAVMRRTEKLEDDNDAMRQDLKDIQQEVKELNQEVKHLTEIVHRLAYEFQRDRENASAERRILLLEIENRFLRFERQLPPDGAQDESK